MNSIKVSRLIKSSPTQLYQAWINPKIMEKWGVSKAKIEPVEGGKFRFETKISDTEVQIVEGIYLEIIPNEKIVKTWVYEPFEGEGVVETEVCAEFIQEKNDQTRIIVTEEGEALSDPEYAELTTEAWTGALEMLNKLCKK